MKTLNDFCERFRISLKKAQKMEREGWLRLEGNTDAMEAGIRQAIVKGQSLTAFQLCALVEDRGKLLQLGKYAGKVETQLDEIGNARGEAAPESVAAYVSDAARGDAAAVLVLVDWIKQVLPRRGEVTHAYLATRLLLGLPANVRAFDVPRVPRALYYCRKSPEFAGWFSVHEKGNRSFSLYHRPKGFDL